MDGSHGPYGISGGNEMAWEGKFIFEEEASKNNS